VRALIHLAMQPAGARLSQADIAAAIDAPAPFVGKVMQQLALAGLVTSQRGIGGGFALHPAATDTTMLDAVTAIEGPLALNTCLSPDEPCRRASFCPAHHVWFEAQRQVVEVLRAATIGALADQVVRDRAEASPATADAASARHGDGSGEAEGPRERDGRRPRVHVRSDEGLQARPRRREGPGATGRFRGTGECPR
jgi:Rrf2 family protein